MSFAFAFDGRGGVAGPTYSTRELVQAGSVPVLDLDEGEARCAEVLGASVRPTGVLRVGDDVDPACRQGHGSPTGFSSAGCSGNTDTFLSTTTRAGATGTSSG